METTASDQLAASNTLPLPPEAETTNLFNAAFAFGGFLMVTALAALSSPTPAESGIAFGIGFADTISAPFT